MRLANYDGRAVCVTDDGFFDLADVSDGAFSSSLDDVLGDLKTLTNWYASTQPSATHHVDPLEFARESALGPVVSAPSQIFAVGLNYRHHAAEMGLALPTQPLVFTKFASSLCGPNADVPIPSDTTDFEAELVAVVGKRARYVDVENALDVVAGYCVGQDYSERVVQMMGSPAQFSMGKSYRNFTPTGPWLTTSDEIASPNELAITCHINGEEFQNSTTADMVFSVAEIVSHLSQIVELRVGDIIFTGSPDGVGQGRTPPVFLQKGDVVVTSIERLGTITNHIVTE